MKALAKKDIDFYYQINHIEKPKNEKKKKKTILLLIPIAMFLILAGVYIAITISNISYKVKTMAVQAYLQSEDIAKQQNELEQIQEQIRKLQSYDTNYENTLALLENHPELSKEMIASVLEQVQGQVGIFEFSYDGYGLSLQCFTDDYRQAPLYVQRLEKLDFVDTVNYTGFTLQSEDWSQYRFSVYILLKIPENTQETDGDVNE